MSRLREAGPSLRVGAHHLGFFARLPQGWILRSNLLLSITSDGGSSHIPRGHLSQARWASLYARCHVHGVNFVELRHGEVRRIPIPRTPVNKAKKRGRSYYTPRPFAL